jgi:hypothetical protein
MTLRVSSSEDTPIHSKSMGVNGSKSPNRPSNEQFLHRLSANSENVTGSRTNSNLELRSSGALVNRGTQPGLIHMKLFSFGA